MTLGVYIGDLCCDEPWTSKKVLRSLNNEVESVKFFHCDPSKIVPIGMSKMLKTIYMHLSNEELCTTRSWKHWINHNVKPIASRLRGKKLYLVVGNEVLSHHNKSKYAPKLLPALRGCYKALNECNLRNVRVVTPLDTSCLSCSYPPSASFFKPEFVPILKEIFEFTVNARSKICFNVYPYFAKQHVSEDFALFGENPGYIDQGRRYNDLFCAQYDSVVHAVAKLGVRNSNRLELVVTETGWPSNGGEMSSDRNTCRYINGIKKVCKEGTPLRPGPREILLFELYDENLKGGPDFERLFGVFKHNGSLKH